MATFYIDPVNGNANYAGSSFALKTSGTDGVGNGTTTFTSATANFSSGRDAGQRINIAGTYYTISSVTNSTTIVLSATNTSGSGKSFWVGGALQLPSQLTSTVGLAAGDTVHVAKTSDPIRVKDSSSTNLNATFNNKGNIVLSAAATANLNDCSGNWTADNSSTVSTSTTRKEGSVSSTITVTTTAQLRAHVASQNVNNSGYTKVSFWIQSSVIQAANTLRLDLCSDANGATPVHSFTIPFILASGTWAVVTFDNGGALSSNINSLGLTTLSGIAAGTITIDNILACNDLTLDSLVSKDSAATIDSTTDGWWPIRSINGTTIVPESNMSSSAGTASRGYYGTTATVAIYVRPIQSLTALVTGNAMTMSAVAGTSTSPITWTGGYDTSSDTQTGETWWGSNNAAGTFITSNQAYHSFGHLNFKGGSISFSGTAGPLTFRGSCAGSASNLFALGAAGANTVAIYSAMGGGSNGVSFSGTNATVIEYLYVASCSGTNINAANSNSLLLSGALKSCNSGGVGISSAASNYFNVPYGVTITVDDNAGSGIATTSTGIVLLEGDGTLTANNNNNPGCNGAFRGRIGRIVTSGNTTAGMSISQVARTMLYINSCNFGEATKITHNGSIEGSFIAIQKYQDTTGDVRFISSLGTVQTDSTTRHTASGYSWKAQPNANATSTYPLCFPLQPIAVDNTATTFNVYCYRTSVATLNARLMYFAGDCIGANSDVSDTANGSVNTWEQLTISVTGTETNGGWTPYLCSWGDASNAVYFDDASAT